MHGKRLREAGCFWDVSRNNESIRGTTSHGRTKTRKALKALDNRATRRKARMAPQEA